MFFISLILSNNSLSNMGYQSLVSHASGQKHKKVVNKSIKGLQQKSHNIKFPLINTKIRNITSSLSPV